MVIFYVYEYCCYSNDDRAAFDLQEDTTASLLLLSFIVTGIAYIMQAFFGHQRAIMEGQSYS